MIHAARALAGSRHGDVAVLDGKCHGPRGGFARESPAIGTLIRPVECAIGKRLTQCDWPSGQQAGDYGHKQKRRH